MPDKPAKALINSHLFRKTGASMKDAFAPIPEDEANRIREVAKGLMRGGKAKHDESLASNLPVINRLDSGQLPDSNRLDSGYDLDTDLPLTGISPDNNRLVTGQCNSQSPLTGISPVINRLEAHKKVDQGVSKNIPLSWELSHQYALVLAYIIVNKNRLVISKSDITSATGVKYANIKAAYRKLISLGYIKPTVSQDKKGSIIELSNLSLCEEFSKERMSYLYDSNTRQFLKDGIITLTGISPDNDRLMPPENHESNRLMTGQSYKSSSSSFLNLKTTTHERVREALENHPEFEFWREQGLSAEMLERNIQEHGFDPEALIISAKHYAFEYSQPGKTPPEKSYLVHFLGGLKRFGLWDRPASYVSYEKRLTEQMRAFRELHEKEIAELEAEKREAAFMEFYSSYQANPDSPENVEFLKQASDFDQKQLREKSDKKMWLRTIWEKANK